MELVTPAIGLVFWTTLAFLILLFILRKFAWKPILTAIKTREESIENSLRQAEQARKEMESLQASNESLLQEAREERDRMLREARDSKDQLLSEAKVQAKEEADKIISAARTAIENEKKSAMAEIKTHVAALSLEVAEKILREQLSQDGKQQELVNKYIDQVNLN